MRWTIPVAVAAVLLAGTACSGEPAARTAVGVPERWYATVDDALAARPEVTAVAQLDNGGRCPLGDEAVLDGRRISDVSDHGVVRLRGTVPAVLCSWYDERVVDVEVAHAPDAAGYAGLAAGSHAVDQPGNEQTEQDVVVDGRTVRVVRIVYPTNPSAGESLSAVLLDEGSRGRVRLQVHRTHLIGGYDAQAIARDLLAFVDR
jgi:hypothetical protein